MKRGGNKSDASAAVPSHALQASNACRARSGSSASSLVTFFWRRRKTEGFAKVTRPPGRTPHQRARKPRQAKAYQASNPAPPLLAQVKPPARIVQEGLASRPSSPRRTPSHSPRLARLQRAAGVLLDQQHRGALLVDVGTDLKDLVHHDGREPIEGSSSSSTLGRAISARPMASICCSPPLMVPASWCLAPSGAGRCRTPCRCRPPSSPSVAGVGAHLQVLGDGHAREGAAPSGTITRPNAPSPRRHGPRWTGRELDVAIGRRLRGR